MNIEIKLFKRVGTYEKDGKDKQFTNYYLGLKDQLIPIEVKYFPNDKFGGRDPGYQGRVGALNLVAELLPVVSEKDKPQSVNPRKVACPKCGEVMRVDDQDGTEYYLVCDKCAISCDVDAKNGELSFTNSDGEEIPF